MYPHKMLFHPCMNDNDCGPNHYCYKVSKLCVNHINCTDYYRAEGTAPARDATQCGPCVTGYKSEILTEGKESQICHEIVIGVGDTGSTSDNNVLIMVYVIVVMVIVSVFVFGCYKIRNIFNCFTRRNAANIDETTDTTNINGLTTANAPLKEQCPIIKLAEDKCIHNNNRPTMNNEYQNARVCFPPQWGLSPPGDMHDLILNRHGVLSHSGNYLLDANVRNEENIVTVLENNIPDQPIMELTIADLPEINIEHEIDIELEDNARNTLLHSADSDTNSSPQSNKRNSPIENKYIFINQSLNPNFNMKVNVVDKKN